jgi:hypothetical protein
MLCVVYAEWHILTLFAELHYAECHYAECPYAECRYADCRGAFFFCLRGFLSGFVCNKNEKNDEKKKLKFAKNKNIGKSLLSSFRSLFTITLFYFKNLSI